MKTDLIKALAAASAILVMSPVFAQQQEVKASSGIDVPCVQNAIDIRDTALANMVNDWSSSARNALETRREALKDSWSITEYKKRRIAQRKAWSDYKKTLHSMNAGKAKERSRAWKQFDHDRKLCKGAYSPEMITGSTYDANL